MREEWARRITHSKLLSVQTDEVVGNMNTRRRFASRASEAATKALAKQYFEIFQAYVKEHNEASLSKGYELARQAMVSGHSSLEMAEIHHEALLRLNEFMESEIKGIAHAPHDNAGQLLTSAHIAIAELAGELPSEFEPCLAVIEKLLTQTEDELRDLSHALRPSVLDNLGLVPAVETEPRRGTALIAQVPLR